MKTKKTFEIKTTVKANNSETQSLFIKKMEMAKDIIKEFGAPPHLVNSKTK